MNDEKKLEILLARWRDEMNGLRRAVVDAEPLTPTHSVNRSDSGSREALPPAARAWGPESF
jgi:hypothetical protein